VHPHHVALNFHFELNPAGVLSPWGMPPICQTLAPHSVLSFTSCPSAWRTEFLECGGLLLQPKLKTAPQLPGPKRCGGEECRQCCHQYQRSCWGMFDSLACL
jgi:hypothetical protein